jgi:hypothetical protein
MLDAEPERALFFRREKRQLRNLAQVRAERASIVVPPRHAGQDTGKWKS